MPRSRLFIVPRERPWREQVPNNLPVPPSLLLGREEDVETVCRLLADPAVRQLTLTGPGGVGKTRLALAVAGEMLEGFEHGVYLVELAVVTDPAMLVPAIADVLQLGEEPGKPLISVVQEHLRDKKILLVLDNFEQIVPAASVLPDLLANCPGLKLLITSREGLGLRSGRDVPVSPLALPPPDQRLPAGDLGQYGAVALFVQRANDIDAGFQLTGDNAGAVVEICRRVDGLPLAIELVTPYLGLLSPRSLLARLTHPLRLLTAGSLESHDRHRTMRDTIAWSYGLLTEQEQRLFRRLSVFAGSFSQEGAEAVCNEAGDTAIEPDHPGAVEVLEGMRSLVGKSLVRRVMQEDGEDPRLGMLETVREYASEQLAASGETEFLRRRHADYYLRLAERVSPNPATKEGLDRLNRLRPEQDNFRAALNWLLQQRHSETAEGALRLLQALQFFWERHTQHIELIAWLEEALAQAGPVATPLKVWALRRGAIQADRRADYELAGGWVEQALRMARKLGDKSEVIECINLQSRVALGLGDYASARSMMEEVLATSREIGNDFMVAATLINLVGVAQHQGDYEGAERLSREGLESFTKLGNGIGIMWALLNLGDTLRYLGRLYEARTELLKALALAQEADHPLAADTLVVLASVTMAEVNQAQEKIAGNQGQVLHAVRLLALAARILERRGSRLEGALQTASEQSLAIAREKVGDEAFNRAWEEGWSLGLDQALELASRGYMQEGENKPRGRGRPKKRVAGGLTDREYDVAALLARGMTNAEIARQLVLSVRTVEAHVANAMQKLGLHTRTEFAAWAMREGVVPHPARE